MQGVGLQPLASNRGHSSFLPPCTVMILYTGWSAKRRRQKCVFIVSAATLGLGVQTLSSVKSATVGCLPPSPLMRVPTCRYSMDSATCQGCISALLPDRWSPICLQLLPFRGRGAKFCQHLGRDAGRHRRVRELNRIEGIGALLTTSVNTLWRYCIGWQWGRLMQ